MGLGNMGVRQTVAVRRSAVRSARTACVGAAWAAGASARGRSGLSVRWRLFSQNDSSCLCPARTGRAAETCREHLARWISFSL